MITIISAVILSIIVMVQVLDISSFSFSALSTLTMKCKKLKLKNWTSGICINLEFVLGNETHKLPWDFEIQTDHLISARRPDWEISNKKENKKKKTNLPNSGLYRPDEPLGENQRKRKERQILGLCQKAKKAIEQEGDGDTNNECCTRNAPYKFLRGMEELEIKGRTDTIQTTV